MEWKTTQIASLAELEFTSCHELQGEATLRAQQFLHVSYVCNDHPKNTMKPQWESCDTVMRRHQESQFSSRHHALTEASNEAKWFSLLLWTSRCINSNILLRDMREYSTETTVSFMISSTFCLTSYSSQNDGLHLPKAILNTHINCWSRKHNTGSFNSMLVEGMRQ